MPVTRLQWRTNRIWLYAANRNRPMHIGMQLIKNGEADAFVTAGNTGAALAVAMFQLKRLKGVKRPAITAVGELMGHLITIADVGANTDTKLEWLKQFALMGDIYAKNVLKINAPRIGLLSNGEEDTKGDQLVRDAHAAFREMAFNFVGNIEPKGLLSGEVDVLITDGYVGNILLKTYEAAISGVFQLMRQKLKQNLRGQLGGTIARPALREVVSMVDPTQYGGAPLLGVNGIVIITHGGATAPVIRNSIQQARQAVEANLLEKIESGLGQLTETGEED